MIPKVLHYCFGMTRGLREKPWSLVHHVCVQSAINRINPSATYLYYEYEPRGAWWQLTRDIVTPVRIRAPREIFGNRVYTPAQRADIVRLEKLLEFGGIYLDCDVFVHRSFDDLLRHSVVLGKQDVQGSLGLCNAVICAKANATFLRTWYAAYKTFRWDAERADEHSVRTPLRLSRESPSDVTVLPSSAFYWPTWEREGLNLIFNSVEPITQSAYATHLWESLSWESFLQNLTPLLVRAVDTNFHVWVRPLVATLPDDYGTPRLVGRIVGTARRTARRLRRKLLKGKSGRFFIL